MGWYNVEFSENQVANGDHTELQELFLDIYIANASPKKMALFSSSIIENKLYIYFSPEAAQNYSVKILIDRYHGEPCDKPNISSGVGLVVGRGDSLERFFC